MDFIIIVNGIYNICVSLESDNHTLKMLMNNLI